MNACQETNTQKLGRFGVQATGHVMTFGLAVVLLLAWLLTWPLFRLGDRLKEWRRQNAFRKKDKYEDNRQHAEFDSLP